MVLDEQTKSCLKQMKVCTLSLELVRKRRHSGRFLHRPSEVTSGLPEVSKVSLEHTAGRTCAFLLLNISQCENLENKGGGGVLGSAAAPSLQACESGPGSPFRFSHIQQEAAELR